MNRNSTRKKSINIYDQKQKNRFSDGGNQLEPGRDVINNILNYSKALSIRKSLILENIEMVLN